jgi:hypothetical protein
MDASPFSPDLVDTESAYAAQPTFVADAASSSEAGDPAAAHPTACRSSRSRCFHPMNGYFFAVVGLFIELML